MCWQLLLGSLPTSVFTCIVFTDFFILQYLSRMQNMAWSCLRPSVIRLCGALLLTSCPDFIFSWLNSTEYHVLSRCYVNSRCFTEEENLNRLLPLCLALLVAFCCAIYSLNMWWRDITLWVVSSDSYWYQSTKARLLYLCVSLLLSPLSFCSLYYSSNCRLQLR